MAKGKVPDLALDMKDRRILYELDADARQSVALLAKKVGLSKQAVHYRIDRLIRSGVINRFVMVLDTQRLGYSFHDLFLEIHTLTPKKEKEIVDFLKSMSTVGWLATTTGKWDFVVALFTKDSREFNDSLNRIFNRFSDCIKDRTFIIDIDAIYCKNKYLVDEAKAFLRQDDTYGNKEPVSLNSKDMLLLEALDQDPRMSMLEVSRKTGISFDTVRRKLDAMKQSGFIQGFKIKVSPAAFNWEWYLLLMELNVVGEDKTREFTKYLQNHKNVVFIINTIGNWNMMLDLHLKDNAHFQDFMAELKEKFGDMIKSHEHLIVTKDHKTTFVPEVEGQ